MISPKMIETAITLINQFGSTITLQKDTRVYNTTTGQMESTLLTSDPIKAVVESYRSDEIIGLVEAGDMRVMIGNTVAPTQNTKVVFNSVIYKIINIEPLYLEDNVVIYTLQVRK